MSSLETLESLQSAIQAQKSGNLNLAKALYVEVLVEDENNVQALCNLGLVYKQNGNFLLALNTLNKAISINPSNVVAYINLASLHLKIDSFDRAIETYEMALKISPKNANIYNLIAIAYESNGDFIRAMEFYKEAIRCDSTFVKAYNNIGVILYKQGRYVQAVEMFKMSLSVDDKFLSTYVNLGAACNKAKMYKEGEDALLKAIELDKNASGAYANLGNIYNKMKEHKNALTNHQIALDLDDSSSSNHANIGITYKNLMMLKEAKNSLEKAIKISPKFVNAHFDLATTYLLLGEYKRGFEEYEWRFHKDEMRSLLSDLSEVLEKPKFHSDMDTKDKTLLLYSEQGFGDIIQFARFANVLKQKYPTLKLKIQVRAELKTLLEEMDCFEEVLVRGNDIGEFDYQLALMSLPHVLKTTLTTLPKTTPYIEVKGNIDVSVDKEKLNIGVVWGASRTSESYEGRVYSLKYLKPLMDDEKIGLYSLQVAGDVEEIKELGLGSSEIVDLEDKLTDFKQTALMIEKLDLVITSDTSVAHLAGALGKETWVMLQKHSEWRWGLDEDKTAWYPSLKLIRQETQGDWESAFKKLSIMIKERTK
jgi:tetratricopeptide (TPR) repeat protein